MLKCFKLRRSESEDYVPGTAASIHLDWEPREGGLVVVSCLPSSLTSVDLAASQPESSRVFPISDIVVFELSFFMSRRFVVATTILKVDFRERESEITLKR